MKQTLLGWMWTTNDVMRYKQSRANQISEKKNNRKEIETRINSLVNVFKLNFQWNHLARSGMYVCDIATVYVYIWWSQKHPCSKLISFAKNFISTVCVFKTISRIFTESHSNATKFNEENYGAILFALNYCEHVMSKYGIILNENSWLW